MGVKRCGLFESASWSLVLRCLVVLWMSCHLEPSKIRWLSVCQFIYVAEPSFMRSVESIAVLHHPIANQSCFAFSDRINFSLAHFIGAVFSYKRDVHWEGIFWDNQPTFCGYFLDGATFTVVRFLWHVSKFGYAFESRENGFNSSGRPTTVLKGIADRPTAVGGKSDPIKTLRQFHNSGGDPRTFHVPSSLRLVEEHGDSHEREESDGKCGVCGDLIYPKWRTALVFVWFVAGVFLALAGFVAFIRYDRELLFLLAILGSWAAWCSSLGIYLGWHRYGLFW